MKRPVLSESSFLGHVFSPKKNAVPTGLRKVKLKGTRGTRKSRVAAFNRMSPVNQELLKRAGTRDAYLKGEGTLADAKRILRQTAVSLGIAKPTRNSQAPIAQGRRAALEAFIASRLVQVLRDNDKWVDPNKVHERMQYLGPNATPEMKKWDYGHFKYAGRPESEYEVIVEGSTRNPFWYH